MSPLATRYGAWALVAGASEGLGAAWANALGARGLRLILLARREAVLAETATSIRERHGVEVVTAAVDLSAPDVVAQVKPLLEGREVGVYVHNAAFAPLGLFLERPVDDALRGLDVSCRAPVLLTHLLGQAMAARGRGAIVLMSSLTAFQGTPFLSLYGATKAFNLTLAEGLNAELRERGVDVIACCAGATRTPGYLRTAPRPAPGELAPEQVVEETLGRLGTRAVVVPGRFNRFARLLLGLLPRAMAVRVLGGQTRALTLHE